MIEAGLTVLMAPREGANATVVFMLEMMAIFAIFYFILIRPQRKEQRRHRDLVQRLRKGDEVITAGGIIGTVIHAQEDRLTIKTGDSTRIVVDRSKIARVVSAEESK